MTRCPYTAPDSCQLGPPRSTRFVRSVNPRFHVMLRVRRLKRPPVCSPERMHPDSNPFEARQARLVALLEERRLPVLVLTKPANIFYLTNFRGSAGMAALGSREPVLW